MSRTKQQTDFDGIRIVWPAETGESTGGASLAGFSGRRSIDGISSVRRVERISVAALSGASIPTTPREPAAFGTLLKSIDGIRVPSLRYQ